MITSRVADPETCTVLTALNLTTLAASGPLPADHIPAHRSFRSADLAPFATNVQFQRTFFFFDVLVARS